MLNPKTTRMVVHTSLNVSLLIIATMVLINEVHKPCDWFLLEGCGIISYYCGTNIKVSNMGFGIGRGTVVEIHKITGGNRDNEMITNDSEILYCFKKNDQ